MASTANELLLPSLPSDLLVANQNQTSPQQPANSSDDFAEILRRNFVVGLSGLQASIDVSLKVDQLSEAKTIFDQLKSFADRLNGITNPAHIDPVECHRELCRIYPNGTASSTLKDSLPLLSSKQCLTQEDVNTVLGEVQQSQSSMANRMIALSVLLSTVTIICQFYQLKKVWETIKEAKNVVDESRMVLNLIRANMTELEGGVHDLEGYMRLYELEPAENQTKRERIVRNIQRKYVNIVSKYKDTRARLSELRIRIDGRLESFEKYQQDKRRDLLMNSVISATQLAANLAQGWVTGNLGHSLLTTASSAATTGLAVLTVANLGTIVIGEQLLIELKQLVSTIDQLQRNLQPIQERVERIEHWLQEHDGIQDDA